MRWIKNKLSMSEKNNRNNHVVTDVMIDKLAMGFVMKIVTKQIAIMTMVIVKTVNLLKNVQVHAFLIEVMVVVILSASTANAHGTEEIAMLIFVTQDASMAGHLMDTVTIDVI